MASNLDGAVYDFIARFTDLDPNNIIKGWQAVSLLPAASEEYAVFTCVYQRRRGTNIDDYNGTDALNIKKSTPYDYQIDVVSSSQKAREHIAVLETVARDAVGIEFFKGYNVSLLYADDSRAIETISETDNYVYRYMTVLHLEEITEVRLSQDYFDKADLNKIKNVTTYK